MGISSEQALDCFRSDDLVGIGMEADAVRRRLHPEGVVSYAVAGSVDCATVMHVGTEAGNTSPVGRAHLLYDKIGETVERGGTGVRLVFGGNEGMTAGIEWLEELFRGVKQRFPSMWIESLSAREIGAIVAACGMGLRETIARLVEAGLDSIASDGTDLVRGDLQEWLAVQRAAHGFGMQTVATMTFGAGETPEQRVSFLEAVRGLQEQTGGFAAFAPVAAEAPGGRDLDGVTAIERLKTLAIGRMFLDNIENVQTIGAAHGLKVLQMGLRFGGNDVGSVSAISGSEEDVRRIIRDAGFRPAQRDMAFRAMMLS
jgi:cyclic dehypoxanthinyl futalosine synthase